MAAKEGVLNTVRLISKICTSISLMLLMTATFFQIHGWILEEGSTKPVLQLSPPPETDPADQPLHRSGCSQPYDGEVVPVPCPPQLVAEGYLKAGAEEIKRKRREQEKKVDVEAIQERLDTHLKQSTSSTFSFLPIILSFGTFLVSFSTFLVTSVLSVRKDKREQNLYIFDMMKRVEEIKKRTTPS